MSLHLTGVIIVVCLTCIRLVKGQSSFLGIDTIPDTTSPASTVSVGYEFFTLKAFTVVSLGRTIIPSGESASNQSVALWEKNGNLIAAITFTTEALVQELSSPVTLTANATYVISMGVTPSMLYASFSFLDLIDTMYDNNTAIIKQALSGSSLTEPPMTVSTLMQGLPNFFEETEFSTTVDNAVTTFVISSGTDIASTGVETTGTVLEYSTTIVVEPTVAETAETSQKGDHDTITSTGLVAVAVTTIVCVGTVLLSVVVYKWYERVHGEDIVILRETGGNFSTVPSLRESVVRTQNGQRSYDENLPSTPSTVSV
eukprot:CFRG0895T1